ncbi:hypothetical protein M8542_39835 [Amycolatopsis sp. OK19-0408]|uniref:Uncharacterized protein n=1 Tax=Amycolatopsis iheyensis TaxID=2945988 RepID=A0A9X2NHS0_9PSEU|nr:hypothetical protein [Amycolatopsis iheyensis]MCR6488999.1 hypothetical protein [Amycolatopsis iheyensis]
MTSGPTGSSSPREPDEASYGFPVAAWRWLARHRPPGPFGGRAWRSPLRGPWLTSVFGAALLVTLPIVILTGLLSYLAYGPQFGQALPAGVGWLRLPPLTWPAEPSWLYRLTQGLHVGLGLVLIPLVLAKLWPVAPKLFTWPPARSIAQVLERLSLLLLVGGILFEIATGVLNIQYDYLFGFSFYTAHYYGTWVFTAAFLAHVALKLPRMIRALRSRSWRAELRTTRAETRPEPLDQDGLVAHDPAAPTLSRRGALAVVGGGALLVFGLTAGQTIGGITRRTALLLPRGRDVGDGPNGFPVNRTATAAGIDPAAIGPQWTLELTGGPQPVRLTLAALAALP